MLSKFVQDTQAETLGNWLRSIDFYSADTLGVDRAIYEALAHAYNRRTWSCTPIAPLSEPVNLQELVGDHFNGARDEIGFQARRIDNLYRWLSETNNVYKAELESVEKAVLSASDALQDIQVSESIHTDNSFWVSDSFNSTAYVDSERSTVQVDTDHGLIMLGAQGLSVITDVQPYINDRETVGIPGCNMLILDRGNTGGPAREPEPLFESQQSTDFSAVLDGDPQTWFELERNFVKPKQKCSQFGRAWVKNSAGAEIDVLAVTQNLDWKAYVQWFNRALPDAGADGKGVMLAEFRDLDGVNSTTPGIQPVQNSDVACKLSMDLVLLGSQPLTFINLIPFTRGVAPLRLDSLKVWAGDLEILLAQDVEITPTAHSTTSLTRGILRRTGTQAMGGLWSVPTDRNITRVQIKLSSPAERVPYGLGHPFQEKYEVTRKEQRIVFFSRVDRDYVWTRIPVNESPPSLFAKYTQSKILGSVPSTLSSLLQYARRLDDTRTRVSDKLNALEGTNQQLGGSQQVSKNLGLLQTGLSSVGLGSVLGKAIPVIGGVFAAVDLAQQLFGFNKTTELLEVRRGYDEFDGWRASIGLRDISLTRVQFDVQSEFVSLPLTFPQPVRKMGLFVEEDIPSAWGPGEWITYYLSVDGVNWTQVGKMGSNNIDSSYTPPQPSEVVYVRAILKGYAQENSTSPLLRHYAVQGIA